MSPFIGSANPEELAVMTEAFDNHCLAHNITDGDSRSYVAHLVMLLFEGGAKTVEEIRVGLDFSAKGKDRTPWQRQAFHEPIVIASL